jgi:predicted nucleic acid-binding protein
VDGAVIDSSVGIKLFVVEEHSGAATQLFQRLATDPPALFFVPDLFFVECANILWKYVRHYGYPASSARDNIVDLQALRLQTVSTADLLVPTFELAVRHDLTAYDACFAALARELELPLITADQALINRLTGSTVTVRFVGEVA